MKNVLITSLSLLLSTSIYAGLTCPSLDVVKSVDLTKSSETLTSRYYGFMSTRFRDNDHTWYVSATVAAKDVTEAVNVAKTTLQNVVSVSGPTLTGGWCGQGGGLFFECEYQTPDGQTVRAFTDGK